MELIPTCANPYTGHRYQSAESTSWFNGYIDYKEKHNDTNRSLKE